MSVYKRNLSSKSQNDFSIKDISLQYSIRYFTKQILQRQLQQHLTINHLPKSTKTLLIPVYHSLTSSKSTRTKRFINSYQHKSSTQHARASSNINKEPITKSNENSIDNNNNNNKQLQCDTNRTKHVSISSSTCTHKTPKMRIKKVHNKRSSTLKKHNNNNNEFQTFQIDTRNISNKLLPYDIVVNTSKGKVIKNNLNTNNIHSLIHYNEFQEQYNEHHCKILRHKLAVLKHQIEKHRIEKTKLENTITTALTEKQRIHTLQTEILHYKKLISTYQQNCNELTKEIHTLQTKINIYK